MTEKLKQWLLLSYGKEVQQKIAQGWDGAPGVRGPQSSCLAASLFLTHYLMVSDNKFLTFYFSEQKAEKKEGKGCILSLQGSFLDVTRDISTRILLART